MSAVDSVMGTRKGYWNQQRGRNVASDAASGGSNRSVSVESPEAASDREGANRAIGSVGVSYEL